MNDIEEYVDICLKMHEEFKRQGRSNVPLDMIQPMASTVFISRQQNGRNNGNAPKTKAVYRLQKAMTEVHEGRQKEVNEFLFSNEYMDRETVSKAISLAEAP